MQAGANSPPIHSLPYELLRDILLFALTPKKCIWGSLLLPPRSCDVLILCRVCSAWRQIALETSRLWAIPRLPVMNRMGYMSTTATNLFLERSGQHLLHVDICPLWPTQSIQLPPTLGKASDRWESFSLQYYTTGLSVAEVNALRILSQSRWANLITIDIWVAHADNWPGTMLDFMPAKQLRQVSLNVPAELPIPAIPWAQLTRLSLIHPSAQVCLEILSSCRNVIHAYISTSQSSDVNRPTLATPVTLEHLVDLELCLHVHSPEEHVEPFLQLFSAPSLISLHLSVDGGSYSELSPISRLHSHLVSFIHHSPKLRQLVLANFTPPEVILSILRQTPMLVSLHIGATHVNRDFMLGLSISRKSQSIVPKLKKLVLMNLSATSDFPFAEFITMVEARQPGTILAEVVVENECLQSHWCPTPEFLDFKHRVYLKGLDLRFLL
ncbi:hypothetical protein MIND_00522500 [Mycena indigotica]|uniref:F-box domain-containing protein n=1 Tax=Mycena indigotica TaxID=2126181 RepID=A0A8H6T0L7_9AGAR|nr:uncharacterized protein MIND_00522500 [Mycena indigotica]KAF7307285.1 hypothetical protein MIND_00522500 [Mycena indigotica]